MQPLESTLKLVKAVDPFQAVTKKLVGIMETDSEALKPVSRMWTLDP